MFDPEVIEDLRKQFQAADDNGDGEIDAIEACELFAKSCSPDATPAEIKRTADSLRHQLDTDKSGKISFDEYCFRFGRKYQMERNRLRRSGSSVSGSSPAATNGVEGGDKEAAASSLEAEREALRREREAFELEKEREKLKREREDLERQRQAMREEAERQQGRPSQGPDTSAHASAFAPGSRVTLQNLRSAPELNGKSATVLRFDAACGRYVVDLDGDGGQKSLRAENLKPRNVQGASGSTGTGPGFGERLKVGIQTGIARVQIWLADYEWWQIALGVAVVIFFLSAWLQVSNRYPSTGGGGAARAAGEARRSRYSDGYEGAGRREPRPRPGGGGGGGYDGGGYEGRYEDVGYEDDYGGGGYGYGGGGYGGGGGGGLLGFLSGGSALHWYLMVGGIAYACWKGIIPVHNMSWFQLYMLWNFLEPLLMGSRRGGRGYRRRGFF